MRLPMTNSTSSHIKDSPFHNGEQELQARTGKRELMERFGRRAIRTFMPEQHRIFFSELPFIVAGSVDNTGWPWASILSGKPGFIQSPDSTTLTFDALTAKGDPLANTLTKINSPLGFLGIEMMSRRRNRVNGRISQTGPSQFAITVDQSFGNCPQYIQNRAINFIREPTSFESVALPESLTTLDNSAYTMIKTADTFFVSSYLQTKERPEIEGVDVSHRGGRPGFVKVEGNILTIPDYPGNYHFNTFGNFLLNPKAGLTFIDFSTGDLLMLTGTVELLWEEEAEVRAFKGAERAWRFTVNHGLRFKNALPFIASFEGYSPNTLLSGDWAQASATLAAEAKREAWRPYRVTRIENESSTIRSIYLEPNDQNSVLPFKAGQFLTVRSTLNDTNQPTTRTYTISSAPGELYYRISVKREEDGYLSRFLHDEIKQGDIIEAKSPRGDFFIDTETTRPAVLIAGGVGITPIISMASHVAIEGFRTRHTRPLTIFHAASTTKERAFSESLRILEQQTNGIIRYFSFISQPTQGEEAGIHFNGKGYINADILRQALALDDYDFYLCGPPVFMQALYDSIRSLGIRDARILTEAFGPASITRQTDKTTTSTAVKEEADEAIITFSKSGFEQHWQAGDSTILETAEAHGLTPNFSCRNGTCGSCAVKLNSGSVTYRTQPTADHASGEILVCCAVPAKGTETVDIEL